MRVSITLMRYIPARESASMRVQRGRLARLDEEREKREREDRRSVASRIVRTRVARGVHARTYAPRAGYINYPRIIVAAQHVIRL